MSRRGGFGIVAMEDAIQNFDKEGQEEGRPYVWKDALGLGTGHNSLCLGEMRKPVQSQTRKFRAWG